MVAPYQAGHSASNHPCVHRQAQAFRYDEVLRGVGRSTANQLAGSNPCVIPNHRAHASDGLRFAARSGIAQSLAGAQIASWSLEVHNQVHKRHARLWKPQAFNDLEDEL